MDIHKIAILVSGAGTNAVNIIEYFEKNSIAALKLASPVNSKLPR